MSEPVLSLAGVSKSYETGGSELRVLDAVDLAIAPGETVALVAPSGAGKSTLLHIAGLLDRPTGGTLHVAGTDMTHANEAARTAFRRDRIGFVYQFHHLLPEFTALENIVLPQRAARVSVGAAEERGRALLTSVGLEARMSHRPAALSGGEQQRVAICRALANKPDLLLADEPTGNLDPETADQVFGVLMTLARETGLSALVATHNLDLAGRMDRIVRLSNGRLA